MESESRKILKPLHLQENQRLHVNSFMISIHRDQRNVRRLVD